MLGLYKLLARAIAEVIKSQKRKALTACFSAINASFSSWTSQGLNLGPPDYESVALTN